MPIFFVRMVLPKRQVRKFLLASRDNPDTPQELRDALNLMEKESDERLMGYTRAVTVEMHKKGILIPMMLKQKSEIENEE